MFSQFRKICQHFIQGFLITTVNNCGVDTNNEFEKMLVKKVYTKPTTQTKGENEKKNETDRQNRE